MGRDHKPRLGCSLDELLAQFRWLWAAHLQAQARTAAQVADFLGFERADQCARRLGYEFGREESEINTVRYQSVVSWVAECCPRSISASWTSGWRRRPCNKL